MLYVNKKGETVEINGIDSALQMACVAENVGAHLEADKFLSLALKNEKLLNRQTRISHTKTYAEFRNRIDTRIEKINDLLTHPDWERDGQEVYYKPEGS